MDQKNVPLLSDPFTRNYSNLSEGKQHSSSESEGSNKFVVTDFISNINQLSKKALSQDKPRGTRCRRCLRILYILRPRLWVALALLGSLSALASYCVDLAADGLRGYVKGLMVPLDFWPGYAAWVGTCLVFGLAAASCGQWISQDAEGSGIPEMKTILSGIQIYRFLSFRTFFAKVLGLITAVTAGLSIGREGPFVHLAAIIASKLIKVVPWLRRLGADYATTNQVLAASVAAGVCATFGAPIGGVLFSIEVTATYYVVNYMWKALYCATWCTIVYACLRSASVTSLIYQGDFQEISFDYQLFTFTFLGVLCAFLGSLFVRILSKLGQLRRRKAYGWMSNRFQYTAVVCVIVSSITYSTKIFTFSDKALFNQMFYDETLNKTDEAEWTSPNLYVKGSFFVLAKILITALSLSCPLPCGVFTPTFTAGAVFGRIYGEILNQFFQTEHMGVYALIGAAAFTSSVTHTLSVAIIVFELTGQLTYLVYMLVAVLAGFGVSFSLHPSIFDVLLAAKGLPYLPALKTKKLYKKTAKMIMEPDPTCLFRDACIGDVFELLRAGHFNLERIPIVDQDHNLLGDVDVSGLRKELRYEFERQALSFDPETRDYLKRFTDAIDSTTALDNNLFSRTSSVEILGYLNYNPRVEEFWLTKVNFSSEALNLDIAPMAISYKTRLIKVHFLFLMLGLHLLYTTKKGVLVGLITRERLIRFKR